MFRVILFQISARALLCKTARFVLLLLRELGSEPELNQSGAPSKGLIGAFNW